jgi:hypothetical protein
MVRRALSYLRRHHLGLIALFIALGGTSYAATKLDGDQIRKRSLPGNRVERNALEGSEVDESKLSQVPSARVARNAHRLDGRDSSDFVPRDQLLASGQTGCDAPCSMEILSNASYRVTGFCSESPDGKRATVRVSKESGVPGTHLFDPEDTVVNTGFATSLVQARETFSATGREGRTLQGIAYAAVNPPAGAADTDCVFAASAISAEASAG